MPWELSHCVGERSSTGEDARTTCDFNHFVSAATPDTILVSERTAAS
jgi:hypothetical protein